MTSKNASSKRMHELCTKLFPICRSITGDGFRQSLDIILEQMGGGRKRLSK